MEEHLPNSLILEILSRLTDSTDLARCRVTSKTLNSLAQDVRSINLVCTLSRYQKSRAPETERQVTPFKTIFDNLVCNSRSVESVSIGVHKSLGGIAYDDVETESDDLYLTDFGFVKDWLPGVCADLRYLSISDFWLQSCWRKSEVLALISSCCHRLLELKVKNAWLSVDGLNPMPRLTNLTLEFVRLEDEDLNKCQMLHFLWLYIPKLVKLKLICIKPNSLVLETPLLSDFHLSLEKANEVRVQRFQNLKNLQLESSSLCSIIGTFPFGNTIKKLKMDSQKSTEPVKRRKFDLGSLFAIFPNMSSLTLGPGAWSEAETYFYKEGLESSIGLKELKEIVAHLVIDDIDVTLSFIFCILDKCTNLSYMALLIHCEVYSSIAIKLISRCTADHPRVRWRWGMWKEGTEDIWVSDGIEFCNSIVLE